MIIEFFPGSAAVDIAVGKLVGFDNVSISALDEPTIVSCQREEVVALVTLVREAFPHVNARVIL